jgi:hypothetical protein
MRRGIDRFTKLLSNRPRVDGTGLAVEVDTVPVYRRRRPE